MTSGSYNNTTVHLAAFLSVVTAWHKKKVRRRAAHKRHCYKPRGLQAGRGMKSTWETLPLCSSGLWMPSATNTAGKTKQNQEQLKKPQEAARKTSSITFMCSRAPRAPRVTTALSQIWTSPLPHPWGEDKRLNLLPDCACGCVCFRVPRGRDFAGCV